MFTRYRHVVIVSVAALVVLQTAAVFIYDLGLEGLRTSLTDGLMLVLSISLFTAVPFGLAFDATRRYGRFVPGTKVKAGAYLGIALNAIVGGISVMIGLVQAALRMRFLNEPESVTSMYLFALIPSLIFAIWVGGAMGWLANRIASTAPSEGTR